MRFIAEFIYRTKLPHFLLNVVSLYIAIFIDHKFWCIANKNVIMYAPNIPYSHPDTQGKQGSLDLLLYPFCFLLIFLILVGFLIEAAKHGQLDFYCDVAHSYGVAHSRVV